MWDANCEAKAWELMGGFVSSSDKPTLEVQQETANWLNQMMPYPGWRFKLAYNRTYWVVSSAAMGVISGGVVVGDMLVGGKYTHGMSAKSSDTLMEMITQLELGL